MEMALSLLLLRTWGISVSAATTAGETETSSKVWRSLHLEWWLRPEFPSQKVHRRFIFNW